ncbi:MAG: hypothetical protein J0H88_12580 [Sphingomonadales bacterium]|nr:hypothetical protein [Sphingomonadales bacterium]
MLFRPLLAATFLGLAVPAAAETLPIAGSDPASANVNDLLRISVDRFEGEGGGALAQRLEAVLGDARFDGRSYYRIVAPESGAPIDGLVTGTTRASVEEAPVIEKRKKCTEYDPKDKDKCLKEVDVDIRCRSRTITVTTTARLVAIDDGSVRYTRPLNARDQQTYCPDRSASRTVDDYIEWARGTQVQAIRRDLAPVAYGVDVRVDENRKGLSKPAAESFKEAIRLTKTSPAAACEAWGALTRDAEPTAALAFNLGLCAEMDRDFDAAIDWYGQAQRLGSKNRDIGEGLARIDRHRRALADWAARKRLMGVD